MRLTRSKKDANHSQQKKNKNKNSKSSNSRSNSKETQQKETQSNVQYKMCYKFTLVI
jgi:hypothetical protein